MYQTMNEIKKIRVEALSCQDLSSDFHVYMAHQLQMVHI